jgi:hypothetical protein
MEPISTIAISRNSRDLLKKLGNKGQTYDQIIQDLVESKRNKDPDSPYCEVGSLQSSDFRNTSDSVNAVCQDTNPIQVRNLCDGNGCSKDATTEIEVSAGELGIMKLNLCESCIPKIKQSITKTEL